MQLLRIKGDTFFCLIMLLNQTVELGNSWVRLKHAEFLKLILCFLANDTSNYTSTCMN